APDELARRRVVGGDEAAHAELGTAVADDDLAVDHPGRAGDRIRLIDRRGLHVPDRLAGHRVQGGQSAIDHADVYLAVVERDAPIDDVAAGPRPTRPIGLGVPVPELLAGARIE